MQEQQGQNEVEEKKPRAKHLKPSATGHHVYQAICEVKQELDRHGGITKDREAPAGGGKYAFRGIDDMYNVLCGLTARHGLVMIPRVVGEPRIDYQQTQKGALQTHVFLVVEVDFVSAVDGSQHTGRFVGEALDVSDKAANKATSAAFKYAHLTAFQIPTHGEEDTEAHHYELAPPAPPAAAPKPKPSPAAQKAITKAIEKAPVEKVNPPLDTSDAVTDEAAGMADAADKANSAKLLFDLAGLADKLPEPGRGVVFGHIHARVVELVAESEQEEMGDWKSLVAALGAPKELKSAFNARYNFFKTQQANA